MKVIFCLLMMTTTSAWCQQQFHKKNRSKRFVDEVEIFAGPILSLNHGNKFIENYNDKIIQNKRQIKIGYSFGLGVYHPINNWLTINARVSFEQKGTKAELDHPLGNERQTILSKYSYGYTTFSIVSRFKLDKKEKLTLSVGGYFANLNGVDGLEIYSDPSGRPNVYNNFKGRTWNKIDPDGAIRTWTFIPGIKSFNEYDYGLILAISYRLVLNEKHTILIQLNDHYGLHNVYNNEFTENLPERNHNISFLISYLFRLSPKILTHTLP